RNLRFEAGASIPINLPGLRGTAQISWHNNKLSAEIPDLAFTSGQLASLRFKEIKLEEGKLKAAVDVGGDMTFEAGGAHVTVKPGSSLRVDGTQFQGTLDGEVGFGEALTGNFSFAFNNEDVSGAVTNITARIPGVTVGGLNVNVRSLLKNVDIQVGGDLNID